MKSALLTLLLLSITTLVAPAVERPKNFVGINWGASPEEAKRIMQARPGVKFPDETDDYKFELTGGTFAGQPVEKWVLEFPDRKFATATVVIKTEGNTSTLYKDFRARLVEKYGSATTDKKLTKARGPNYQPGQRSQSLGTQSIWRFNPNLKEKGTIVIQCEMAGANGQAAASEDQLKLAIRYINETLTGAAGIATGAGEKPAVSGVKKEEL